MSKRKNTFLKESQTVSSFYIGGDSKLLRSMNPFFKEQSEKYRRIKR